MELLVLLLKTMGLMVGTLAVLIVGTIVLIDIWGKRIMQDPKAGRIIGIFDDNGRLFSKILRIDGSKAYLGKGEDAEEYDLDIRKQRTVLWPAGLPWIFQIPVRAHLYVRNQSEPIDLKNPHITLSARARMMLSDETMLKTAWQDARESAEGGQATSKPSKLVLIMIFANLAVSCFGIYLLMQVQSGLGLKLAGGG